MINFDIDKTAPGRSKENIPSVAQTAASQVRLKGNAGPYCGTNMKALTPLNGQRLLIRAKIK